MYRYARPWFFVATVAAVVSLGLGASEAWSDTGRAMIAKGCPAVQCVESHDGNFCLCRAGADVCSNEKAVPSCGAQARGVCCVSPVGFCYCSTELQCTFAEDRVTDRCDATMQASPSARCTLEP
jgi:hypothetical protein